MQRPSSAGGILVLSENTLGEDKIIADLHGHLDCLNTVLDSLGEHDRLFIAGDLFDRGPQSDQMIPTIMAYQTAHPDQLYIVAGNHELICLEAIFDLETLIRPLLRDTYSKQKTEMQMTVEKWLAFMKTTDQDLLQDIYPNTVFDSLILHLMNGGEWLVYLFRHELEEHLITLGDHGQAIYDSNSKVWQLMKTIVQLPIIIHVQGENGFNVVHADMPINDLQLILKLSKNDFSLTPEQQDYAVWAREKNFTVLIKINERSPVSLRTYTGHSIVAEGRYRILRKETNSIDVDVGAFYTNMILVVNHHAGICQLMGPGVERLSEYPALEAGVNILYNYLQQQKRTPGLQGLFAKSHEKKVDDSVPGLDDSSSKNKPT